VTRLLSRRSWGLLAVVSLVVAYAWLLQGGTDNERSHYALVRALASGTASIDETRFEVGDWATVDIVRWEGHTYSNKPPGLAFLTVGPYLGLRALGAAGDGDPTRMLWALSLFGAVLPAAVLLLLVRRVADRVEPGLGTAVAVTLGLGTLVLAFATTFHSHVLSACLVFAAFAVLFLERDGRSRLALVAAGGLLAGLAVTTDYPNAIAGLVLGGYAITRAPRARRAAAYAAGFLLGIAPLLAYQHLVFGSPLQVTYAGENLRGRERTTDELGSYAEPSFRHVFESLFSMTGLFTTAPVLLCGLLSLVLLYRRGLRAEAIAVLAIAALVVLYNASFRTEFDSFSGGERYLISIMPLLALPLALSFRRFPTTTGGLGLVSAVLMVALTSSHVRSGIDPSWFRELEERRFPQTVLSFVGVTGWYAVLPFFVAVTVAVAAAVAASDPVRASPAETAFGGLAVLAWAGAAAAAPNLYVGDSRSAADYVHVGLFAAALAVAALLGRLATRRIPVGPLRPERLRG
jgi:hypothetical protein